MKYFSRLFLYVTIGLLLFWQLPWCYNFFMAKSVSTPFALYSTLLGDFILMENQGEKGFVRHDVTGKSYTQEEVDSLLPFFYVRQLTADGRFPDSIGGIPVTPREVHQSNFSFRISPREVNSNGVSLYPLLESKSKRVDLKMPDDVFRITDKGIQFIDMASNSIDEEKSHRFTQALQKKGFVFPAYRVSGNPTARKEYDEGYLLLDSQHNLFHLKQVVGRPYVRAIPLPPNICMEYVFITEFKDRQILGLLTDTKGSLYVMNTAYEVTRTGVPFFNPETENLSIFGNMLDWTISVKNETQVRYYALDAFYYQVKKALELPLDDALYEGLHFTSTNDKWVKPRL